MNIQEMIDTKLARRNAIAAELSAVREQDAPNMARVEALRSEKSGLDAEIDALVAATRGPGPSDGDYTANSRAGGLVQASATTFRKDGGKGTPARFVLRDRPDVPAVVGRGESFGAHPLVREHAATRAANDAIVKGVYGGSLGQMVRTVTDTGTSAVVPADWATDVIDLARNYSAVLNAGAQIVPMNGQIVNIGRVTGDPTAAFRTEGSAITPSDPTLDNVTLTSKTMSCLVQVTMEWLQDAINGEELVRNEIAKAMALKLDYMALYGGVVTANSWAGINLPVGPNPRGVAATLLAVRAANVLGNQTNGTALTRFNELIDLDYAVENLNESPTALLAPTKLLQSYAKLIDSQNRPLDKNQTDLRDLPFIPTNQVASAYTQGTLTTAADAFVGDWSQLLIGQRLDFTLQRLDERYADSGMIGFVMHWRGDIAPARSSAFAVYKALTGSA
ncbi:phage major capsid protein [Arthrobacter sp. efr-133-R2A-120]|uniref:phage major capsid protein n=1 Tax=Arthrobacter sp. efr-133-R2A-120 TaxID=3040277 RepID=UPI00254DBB55|nr:phage major capsid protein [Arthrobacter sp. efr-133-R2A-120]